MINALMLTLGAIIGFIIGSIICLNRFCKSLHITTFKHNGKKFYISRRFCEDGFMLSDEDSRHITLFDENGKFTSNIDIEVRHDI